MATLLLPSQSAVLTAYAVLTGSSPGNIAFRDHQAFINTPGVGVNGYKAALEGFLAGTSTAALATTLLANLGLGSQFTQAQAVAFLNANPGNRVGAMIDLSASLYNYTGTDAGLLAAKTAYVNSIDGSYIFSSNPANLNGIDFASATSGITTSLTTGFDNLTGTAFNDIFLARTIGNVATLNDGDRLDGGAGIDTVYVDFAASNGGLAITPVMRNIETVVIRAQGIPTDATNGNNISNASAPAGIVQIDAQRSLEVNVADRVVANSGVTRWESNNSRSDVVIEDVRIGNTQRTKDVTIAMVETDPGNVDFAVYFDQLSLRNSGGGTSTLIIRVMDTVAAANPATAATPLLNNPLDTFRIGVNGVLQSISLNSAAAPAAAANADTYAQLLAAFQAALGVTGSATAALGANFTIVDPNSGLSVTGQEIVLTGAAGLVFSTPAGSGWVNTTGATVPNNSNIYTLFNTASTTVTELVTSTVVLDDVGRGSTGGDLVIGGLSAGQTSDSRGVERFEITVEDNSRVQTINSTNNSLREVTIKNGPTSNTVANAYRDTVTNAGKLFVNGDATQPNVADSQNGNNLLPGVENNSPAGIHHGAGAAGFADVRLIDGSAMTGDLQFTASVSTDSIAKYVVRTDGAPNPFADVAGIGNVNFSATGATGANFAYAGGAGNDRIVTTIEGTVAGSRSSIVSGQSDFTFLVEGGAGNDTIIVNLKPGATLNGGLENWANNQDLNDNIAINAGAGNDTIRTPGTGDIRIDAGDGNDTVYTDNTGAQTVANLAGAVGINAPTTTSNGVWVFNTADQVNAVATNGARNLTDLRSDANNTYNFYKGTVTVTFKDIPSVAITLANAATFRTTDLEINQAIKNAINTDVTLNKLLVAQDGPGNTLVVTSLIDGVMAPTDLTVAFAAPAASTVFSQAEITGIATAYGNATLTTNALALAAASILPNATRTDYTTAMAQDSTGVNIVGAASVSTSDNFITPGAGNDVIVLGTTVGVDLARSSNEVITLATGFGDDVVVNFNVGGFGVDHINMAAFLGGAPTVGVLSNTANLVTVVNEVTTGAAANNTLALVTTIVRAGIDTAVQTAATKQVFVVVTASNVGTVYSVANGVAVGDAVVVREGSIDLADTLWSGLTATNFTGVTATAEGASSAGAVVVVPPVVPGAPATVVVPAAGAAVVGAAGGNFTYNIAAPTGTFAYSIPGFGAGDKIVSPAGLAPSLINGSFSDGNVALQYATGGNVVTITLTGLTNAQDGSLFGANDLNTVFGAGTFA